MSDCNTAKKLLQLTRTTFTLPHDGRPVTLLAVDMNFLCSKGKFKEICNRLVVSHNGVFDRVCML